MDPGSEGSGSGHETRHHAGQGGAKAHRLTRTIKLLDWPQSETGASSHSYAHRRLWGLTGDQLFAVHKTRAHLQHSRRRPPSIKAAETKPTENGTDDNRHVTTVQEMQIKGHSTVHLSPQPGAHA